jgi:hypothetical protein
MSSGRALFAVGMVGGYRELDRAWHGLLFEPFHARNVGCFQKTRRDNQWISRAAKKISRTNQTRRHISLLSSTTVEMVWRS